MVAVLWFGGMGPYLTRSRIRKVCFGERNQKCSGAQGQIGLSIRKFKDKPVSLLHGVSEPLTHLCALLVSKSEVNDAVFPKVICPETPGTVDRVLDQAGMGCPS